MWVGPSEPSEVGMLALLAPPDVVGPLELVLLEIMLLELLELLNKLLHPADRV